jgi:hypothetical protein
MDDALQVLGEVLVIRPAIESGRERACAAGEAACAARFFAAGAHDRGARRCARRHPRQL